MSAAKEQFRRGVALLQAADHERALEMFLLSRAAFASKQNTINAAVCLDKLGRSDEALEMYEEAIAAFGRELADDDRQAIAATMATLQGKVATLDLSANVESATVSIDGRPRGKLPRQGPLRVLPGEHRVRVTRDGYATFEQVVKVEPGGRVQVDARLEPLAATGWLRVEDTLGAGAEILIDGAFVGVSPWEGVLAPGPHVVTSRKDQMGSAPTQVTVLTGQTALVRLRSSRLGQPLRVTAQPATAEVRIDGVTIGAGRFAGVLPLGAHRVEVVEAGYFDDVRTVEVSEAQASEVEVRLLRDEAHPRWPKSQFGRLWVAVHGGWVGGPTMGAAIEESCPERCSKHSWVTGGVAGARVGFELPFGLSPELGGGYLSLRSDVTHWRETEPFTVEGQGYATTFKLDEVLRLKGYFISGGVSYRRLLGAGFSARVRGSVGVLFAEAARGVTRVTATTRAIAGGPVAGGEARAELSGADTGGSSTPVFVAPEVGVERAFEALSIGVHMAGLFFVSTGPSLAQGAASVENRCEAGAPVGPGCTPRRDLGSGKAFGAFSTLSPQLSLQWAF